MSSGSVSSRLILVTAAAVWLSSCESERPQAGRGGGTAGAPMTASGELAQVNPKPMDAQGAFFGEKIEVEAMLAKSDVAWKKTAVSEGQERSGGGRRGGFSGGFGGGRRGGGRRGGGGGGENTEAAPTDGAPRAPTIRASNEPPVQLQLRLTNHGDAAVEVEVLDFNSDLGNFVVQPKKITLPPHETVEADPMTSRLGVPAVEEIPITVRLRIDGKTETQVLKLRPRSEAPST